MNLYLGCILAFFADMSWRVFLPGMPYPQLFVLWLLWEASGTDDYAVPTLAFVAGAAWDAGRHGIFLHHSLVWLLLVLIVRRMNLKVWFEYTITQFLLALAVSFATRGLAIVLWLSRFSTDVAKTRFFELLLIGAGLDALLFPVLCRLGQSQTKRSRFGTVGL